MIKQFFKAALAVLLSLCFTFSCFADRESVKYPVTERPTVYLHGQGTNLHQTDNDKTSPKIYPLDIDVMSLVDSCLKELTFPYFKGLITGDWDKFCDRFIELAVDLISPIALDNNGEVTDGSGGTYNPYLNRINQGGTYNFGTYSYYYDWRIDPYDSADMTYNYCKGVHYSTGKKKVDVIGRCIGSNVVLAMLEKHCRNNDLETYLRSVVFYCAGFEGIDFAGKIFTGQIHIDSVAADRFLKNYFSDPENDYYFKNASKLINLLSFLKIISGFSDSFNKVYGYVYQRTVPEIIRKTYGTMPSFWSLIGDKYYEDAKSFIFGDEIDEYSGLIEKIDHYHYDCQLKYREIIDKCVDKGIHIYIVAKYGRQLVPIVDDIDIQSDSILELTSAAPGTVCSDIAGRFTDSYVENAKAGGLDKYIAPDCQVDSSEALLRDHTWYIKDCSHLNMPDGFDYLLTELVNSGEYVTIDTFEKYPQYLVYDGESSILVPMTEENCNTNPEWD